MRTHPIAWLRGLVAALILTVPVLGIAQDAKPFTREQLDQMTAPVALYPDSLLAQLFMATTYPDDFALAYQWSKAHPDAKGDDAVNMVQNEDWDPSVQSMVAFPEVLITLGDKTDWVRNMGDAFLDQPEDVMDSVQRLRQQAQKAGNLSSNEQIKVSAQAPEPTTVVVQQQAAPPPQVIVIEPAQPSVVYVPAYNPAVVYGPWAYPAYPPYYYPPPPGYWFSRTIATGIAWGVGIGISNALWGGCNWGRGSVNVNVNRYNNINVNRRIDVNSRSSNWNHNPDRRKTAYRGGDNTRKQLERKRDSGNREQYRGKTAGRNDGRDGGRNASRDASRNASRDASRERAAKSMEARGVDAGRGSASDRAQRASRDVGARDKAAGTNRNAAQARAQSADRDAARQRSASASRDNALRGANDRQAKQQIDRGSASRQAAQSRPQAQARPQQQARPQARPQQQARPQARPQPQRASPRGGGGGGGGGRAGGGGGRHR